MNLSRRLLAAAALGVAMGFGPDARALVSLQDGLDHVFVDATAGIAYDSNVFANKTSGGSLTYSGGLTIDFVRRAGWIGVNASVGWAFTNFAQYSQQNFFDPSYSAEFTKQTGRTTGDLKVSAQRQARADVDVGTRDVSWNYDVGLNVHYPVISRYSITGVFDYTYIDYEDRLLFTNLATYSAGANLYYVLNEERDLFGGYRYRYEESANDTFDTDHNVYLGVSGRILPEINGSIQGGYEIRALHGNGTGSFRDFTASGSATWNLNRKIGLTLDLNKDFGTTANDIATDTASANLSLQYGYTAKISFSGGLGVGETRFLGVPGEVTPGGPDRRDYYVSANAAVHYTVNSHFKASLSYSYFHNWSNLGYAEFPRSQWSLTVSSHW
jgi:hypothetical protein